MTLSPMTLSKICGIATPAALEAAIAGSADYIGLVHFTKSPRHLELPAAAELAALAHGRTRSVVLLVDPDDALVAAVTATVKPDMLQLHGKETPERVAAIRAQSQLPVMKAVGVATREDVAAAAPYFADGVADHVLFDAKPHPRSVDALPGGNGLAFDWRILEGLAAERRFALAGGLHDGNVGQAIALTGAWLVDVSSGVETAPGQKSPELIHRFLAAVKTSKSAGNGEAAAAGGGGDGGPDGGIVERGEATAEVTSAGPDQP